MFALARGGIEDGDAARRGEVDAAVAGRWRAARRPTLHRRCRPSAFVTREIMAQRSRVDLARGRRCCSPTSSGRRATASCPTTGRPRGTAMAFAAERLRSSMSTARPSRRARPTACSSCASSERMPSVGAPVAFVQAGMKSASPLRPVAVSQRSSQRHRSAKEAAVGAADPEIAVVVDRHARRARGRETAAGAEDEPVARRPGSRAPDCRRTTSRRRSGARRRSCRGRARDDAARAVNRHRRARTSAPIGGGGRCRGATGNSRPPTVPIQSRPAASRASE